VGGAVQGLLVASPASVDAFALEAQRSAGEYLRSPQEQKQMVADELTPHEKNSLLRIADGAEPRHEVEEAAVSRLESLSLVEQRGVSFGLTLMGVRTVAQLKRN
jgi:hypothetical protein